VVFTGTVIIDKCWLEQDASVAGDGSDDRQVHIYSTTNTGSTISNCHLYYTSRNYGIKVTGNTKLSIINNQMYYCGIYTNNMYSRIIGNRIELVDTNKSGISCSANYCYALNNTIIKSNSISVAGWSIVIGNHIAQSFRGVSLGEYSIAVGNYVYGATFDGFYCSSTGGSFIGNISYNCARGFNLSGTKCYVSGNKILGTASPNAYINTGTCNHFASDNWGIEITQITEYSLAKNTSGGALAAGDVVVLKAVAAGNEVTTTVIQGDDNVYGMTAEAIANNAWGLVQVKGKTTALKVNGTVDIAIGDILGTFTAAGIAMKAAAGDQGFARALEAYTGDDSNGVIDAYIKSPWD
jgi:hypothetical protein